MSNNDRFLLDKAKYVPDAVALEDDFGNTISYGELGELCDEYNDIVMPRSLIFLLCDYNINTVALYYCMMSNKVVPVLLSSGIDKDFLANLMEKYNPQYIWCSINRKDEFNSGKIILEKDEHVLIKRTETITEMYSELALLLTTSGSTGSPKLVRLSYSNILSEVESIAKVMEVKSDDKLITSLPMNFSYGLCMIHMHWIEGATVHVTDLSMVKVDFWNNIKKYKITNFAGVPFSFEMLKRINISFDEYSSLRFVSEAGGKLPENLQVYFGEKLTKNNIRFYICYGQTEGVCLLTVLPYENVCNKLGSIGLPIQGVKVSLATDGSEEFLIEGKCVCLGYSNSKEELKYADDNKGVLHTGDIAFFDNDGYVYLKGRIKRLIKFLGVRYSLEEIENLLANKFSECSFACSGFDDNLKIYYTGNINSEDIYTYCKEKLQIQRKMVSLKNVLDFPRNVAGKIMYDELDNIR